MRRPNLTKGPVLQVGTPQLRITGDGAYFLPSIGSTATRMRICGVIWIRTQPPTAHGSGRQGLAQSSPSN
jgi:hypothetical protein